MAVETKYVVVRKGEEKMTFASKKEADAHDKLLDMAEAFTDWLLQSGMQMDETQARILGSILLSRKTLCSIFCVPASFLRSMPQRQKIKLSQTWMAVKKSEQLKRPDCQNTMSPILSP